MYGDIPIVRLTVEGMKHQIIQALNGYQVQWDEQIQAAVEAYCQPENIQLVLNAEVNRVLDSVIRDEVERFYRYGQGRKAIADSVHKRLTAGDVR